MPVVDLRNILGLPATPPENPGFQRTRQLANGTQFENAMALADQATAIRQQRPFAALQAIQNQQDEIAQRAQNLRLQQEAQIAAQQATQGLTGLTPDHPDYMANRQRILQQNPTALLDPQFRNALNIYDEGYDQIAKQRQAQQSQIAAAQRQAHGLALRYITAGGDPNNPKILDAIQNGDSHTIAAEYGKLNMAAKEKAPKDQSLSAYEKIFNLAKDEMKAIQEAAPDPEREKIVAANYEKAKADYLSALQGLTPQAAQAVAKGESVVPAPAAEGAVAPVSGGVAPGASPAVIPAKIIDPAAAYEAIPTKTEADYLRFAGDKNATPEFREKVLKDLKAFAAKDVPVAEKGGSIGAVKERDKRIADTVKLAEKTAARADEENDYREAWTKAKLDIDTALNKMAEDTGYSPEQLAGTIAAGGQRILFKVGDKKLSPQQWLESLIGGKFHESAKPFQRWSNTSVGGQAAGKLASENWGRIFDAYRQEKAKPVASAAPAVNVAPPEWKPGQSVEFPGVEGTFTRNK